MSQPTVEQVWADPDFQGLPAEEKRKVLLELDPDFAGLPEPEQYKVVGLETGNSLDDTSQNIPSSNLLLNAAKGVFTKPTQALTDFATNPSAQASALPAVLGTVGSTMGGPVGGALGTSAGEAFRQLAMRALSEKAPQTSGEAAKEIGKAAALGLVMDAAVGVGGKTLRLLSAGKRIGEAEKAAGVITKAADRYPTSGTVGEVLNTLEDQVTGGTLKSPQDLRTAKDIIDFVHQNPKIVGKTKNITVQAARVGRLISQRLNDVVPGRAGPASDFAKLARIKNAASMTAKGFGLAAGGAVTLATIRAFLQSR